MLLRGLSPFWLVVIGVFLTLLSPGSIGTLARNRAVRVAAAFVATSLLLAATYVLWADALAVLPVGAAVGRGIGAVALWEQIIGHVPYWFDQFIGTFGSAYPPLAVIAAWVVVASTLVVSSLATAVRRHAVVLCVLGITALVLPLVLVSSQAHRTGIVWQARDGYPLYTGVLVVAGAAAFASASGRGRGVMPSAGLPSQRVVRRMTLLLALAIPFVQLGNLIWALRRYRVGLGNVANPIAAIHGAWNPPISAWALAVASLAVCIAYGWWIYRVCRISAGAGRVMVPT